MSVPTTPLRVEPIWKLASRCLWIAIQLIAVYALSNQVSPFFYQRF